MSSGMRQDGLGNGADQPDFRLLFEQSPDILLVLLPDAPRFTMIAATDARLEATHTTRDSLGRGLFEEFPDNPDDPGATGTNNLRDSLERVLATRRPDTMPVQKYDIRGPDGSFTIKYWSPKNLPVLGADGEVRYILHRVEEVTELVQAGERGEALRDRTRAMEHEVIRRSNELAGALKELRAANASLVEMARERRAWESQLEDKVRDRTARLSETTSALKSQLERMNLLDHITRAIAERQDLASIFRVVIRNVEESLPAAACWIGMHGPETAALERHDTILYEPDLRPDSALLPWELQNSELRCCIVAPLRGEQGVTGILLAARREPAAFSSGETEFLRQLAEHVNLAVQQAQLHQSLWNAYDELRQSQQTVLQQERLGALGQMASGIAHDINNAITPAMLYVENLLESDPELSPRARQSLPVVLQAIEDVAATVGRLREFYRPREMQAAPEPVNLNPLVQQVVELTRARWSDMPQQGGFVIQVQTALAPDLPQIMGSQSELREALTNLLLNAVDAMPEGGTLTIRTAADAQQVHLVVSDTGAGMDEETRRKCLEPFFTTKGERGTGLGLAMVYGIVQRHDATIQIASAPGKGTDMQLAFAIPERPALPTGAHDSAATPATSLRLLLVDDDALLLKSLREILEEEGHAIVTAGDGRAGIDTFLGAPADARFDAVITDLGMPRMDGRAVAKAIKEASPHTPVILLTGWGQRPEAGREVLPHIDRVLGKPPKLRELRAALAQCCPPHS